MGIEPVYRIAKWREVFEKSDAARIKTLEWVSMPVAFGNGYHAMLDEFGDEAAAIYGAWCALVSVAARTPVRGVLATSHGKPYSIGRIARETHLPAQLFEKLIAWASSESVAWLEVVEPSEIHPDGVRDSSGQSPDGVREISVLPDRTGPDRTRPDLTPAGRYTGGRSEDGGEGTDGELPAFVSVSDRQRILPVAEKIAKAVKQRMARRDSELALRAAAIAVLGNRERWLDAVLDDIRSRTEPPEKPWGWFKGALAKSAERSGWNFYDAAAAIEFEPLPQVAAQPP